MKGFGWSEVKSRGMSVASQLVDPTADITPKREKLEVSEKKPTSALDRPLNHHQTPPVELFDWPIDLLPAQRKTIESAKAGLLAGAGGCLDGLLNGSSTLELKEASQFLNPIIQTELRTIKRIYKQPAVTRADQYLLRSYKENYQKDAPEKCDNKTNVEDNIFKLVYDKSSEIYRVSYASERIPFNKVVAITYAWHETEAKTLFHVYGRKEEKPIQLGVEWDVDEVLATLAELSKDNWIWMDQFSLVQDTVTTKALCSDIPTIYRNSRVVAFLPYKVCSSLLDRIDKFREQDNPNVSAALAEVMLHDLVCECTDGLYGWLSRLWTWQELMLASSLRLVWGLGVSHWTRREIFKEDVKPEEKREDVVSRALGLIGDAGKRVSHVVKHSITNVSVFEQPITRLLNELAKRNTQSVIIRDSDTATLSMGYYFCMRLLCGAEVYMPSASRTAPINCLKVLQQIASTGRKGGSVYDCYYAAAAFIADDTSFLPDKNNFRGINNLEEKHNNVAGKPYTMADDVKTMLEIKEELALRAAYFGLYEREQSKQSHRRVLEKYRNILDDPAALQQEYNALLQEYTKRYAKEYNRSPELNGEDIAALQKALIDLYHEVQNIPVVKHCGVPVPSASAPKIGDSMDNFHPLAWNKKAISRRNLERLDSTKKEQEDKNGILSQAMKRLKAVSDEKKDSKGGFLNAFVLSGMHEEAFYETQHCESRGEVCFGTAYDITSIKRIKVGGTLDLCFASIYKIIANMHPLQLTRARNFNTIPTEMNLSLYPIAHAIIHATCFTNEEHPAHLAHVVKGLLSRKITAEAYVNAVALLVGEGFDFILDENKDRNNQFELVKITFSDGTRCVGIISRKLENAMANTLMKSVSTSDSEALVRTTARQNYFANTSASTPDPDVHVRVTAPKNFLATGKKFVERSAVASVAATLNRSVVEAYEEVAATRTFVKESVGATTEALMENSVKESVMEAVAEVNKEYATKKVMETKQFVAKKLTAATTEALMENSVKESVMEAVAEVTKEYATKKVMETKQFVAKLTAATIASTLSRASVKVVKSHHRLLLCSGGETDVSDWSVVGYIPGFDAEVNKAVLGPISHSGVQIKLKTVGDDSPAAPSA